MRIFLKYPQIYIKKPKISHFLLWNVYGKKSLLWWAYRKVRWLTSLSLPNRQVKVKWNRGPGITPLILNHRRFFLYPSLLTLSKQSTQVVQVLNNNSSYGLVWTKDIVNSYYCAHVIWVPMILIFNLHWFALKSLLLANKSILEEGYGSWFMERMESRYKQCFFKNMISIYTKDYS
jgi:hypothetical protein